jgi:hypothetical protein
MNDDWEANLIEDPFAIAEICRAARRVAVLGIKPESRAGQPAHYVPRYLKEAGLEVIPVPVHYPEVTEILGAPVVRSVAAAPGPLDIVDVFRRSRDVPEHVDDLVAAAPDVVWLQSGIAHDEAAERLAKAGIRVVQNRCLMVEHRRATG